MRITVSGGVSYQLTPGDYDRLNSLLGTVEGLVYKSLRGLDRLAVIWAQEHDIPVSYIARDGSHGRAAGAIRNMRIMDEVDAIIVFPGERGSCQMVAYAKSRDKLVMDWTQTKGRT